MLNLPQKFQNDIQGNTTNLVPLIIIDERLYLSTNELTLDNHYLPLVKNLGSIKESIDVFSKTFKTSNVTVDFINSEYLDVILSEKFFSPSVINKKINFYLKSQSALNIDDCLLVYTGYIKNIEENSEIISIEAEELILYVFFGFL